MGAILRQIHGYLGHGTSPHRGDTWTIRKNKNNRFFIYGPHYDLYIYIVIFVGPGGPSIVILVPSSFPDIISPISTYVKNNNLI